MSIFLVSKKNKVNLSWFLFLLITINILSTNYIFKRMNIYIYIYIAPQVFLLERIICSFSLSSNKNTYKYVEKKKKHTHIHREISEKQNRNSYEWKNTLSFIRFFFTRRRRRTITKVFNRISIC